MQKTQKIWEQGEEIDRLHRVNYAFAWMLILSGTATVGFGVTFLISCFFTV